MKISTYFLKIVALTALFTLSGLSFGASLHSLIDDFSDPSNNSLGLQRQFINDSVAGGSTTAEQFVASGVLHAKGAITPPRGQPGWASSVFLFDAQGLPQDATEFDGVLLRVKVLNGSLSVSANSSEVTNFDYHAAPIAVKADGKFHEVKIPFSSMKRAWSEQTTLNPKTLVSLSVVAFALKKETFEFELDELRFYVSH